ncbi:MAG: sigma 54-interacting transcriptional regulator [Bacteroidetes bacterium]|nr:sigma 54-interacting transcriptional regulator [Bacteroidota bacterium]
MEINNTERKLNETLGDSEGFLDFQQQISRAAVVDRPVLVIGERGSGKEMAVSRLHFLSGRWQEPFVTINCAALPPSLIETELFGHEAGAFTGAVKARKGRFEEATGGTLFLDEIGLIPLEVQEKILRVVEYGTFERVGSSRTFEVNVRIVGATNADLPSLCKENKFKQDLLDRLSFEVLFIPPLRARGDDIILLAQHFASRMAYELGRDEIPEFSSDVVAAMLSYKWPGNVRELKNTVERAVYRTRNSVITEISLNPFDNPYTEDVSDAGVSTVSYEELFDAISLDKYTEAGEMMGISFLQRALDACESSQKDAAVKLGLTYDQFRGLYRKYKGKLRL